MHIKDEDLYRGFWAPKGCEWHLDDGSICGQRIHTKCYCEEHFKRAYINVQSEEIENIYEEDFKEISKITTDILLEEDDEEEKQEVLLEEKNINE